MAELLFTVFEGPDAGLIFFLRDKPLTVGRDARCDIQLNDDRVSRMHSRLIPTAAGAKLRDEGSSNGTFLNGELIHEKEVREGDVFVIGNSHIVFGRKPLAEKRRADTEILGILAATRPGLPGEQTEILPDAPAPLRANALKVRPMELIAVAVEAAEPAAKAQGIRLVVELEPADSPSHEVYVDPQLFYRAIAGMMACLLQSLAGRPAAQSSLVVRLADFPIEAAFGVEIICAGARVPRERVDLLAEQGLFKDAEAAAMAHGGSFTLMPGDPPGCLARLKLPLRPADAESATLLRL